MHVSFRLMAMSRVHLILALLSFMCPMTDRIWQNEIITKVNTTSHDLTNYQISTLAQTIRAVIIDFKIYNKLHVSRHAEHQIRYLFLKHYHNYISSKNVCLVQNSAAILCDMCIGLYSIHSIPQHIKFIHFYKSRFMCKHNDPDLISNWFCHQSLLKDLSMMYRALWDRRHEGATRIRQCTQRYAPRALTDPRGPFVPPISQCTIHHA